jgi:hypothetical protein
MTLHCNVPLGPRHCEELHSANKLGKVLRANLFSHKACIGSAKAIKVSFAMENRQLSQQRSDHEARRSEYKSPTLRKLGKLTDVTLTTDTGSGKDNAVGTNKKSQ